MTDHYATRRGEARPAAKMSPFRVRALRDAYASETPRPSMAALARDFGLSKATVHAIITRRYWRHVP
jgi:hypothetical protein